MIPRIRIFMAPEGASASLAPLPPAAPPTSASPGSSAGAAAPPPAAPPPPRAGSIAEQLRSPVGGDNGAPPPAPPPPETPGAAVLRYMPEVAPAPQAPASPQAAAPQFNEDAIAARVLAHLQRGQPPAAPQAPALPEGVDPNDPIAAIALDALARAQAAEQRFEGLEQSQAAQKQDGDKRTIYSAVATHVRARGLPEGAAREITAGVAQELIARHLAGDVVTGADVVTASNRYVTAARAMIEAADSRWAAERSQSAATSTPPGAAAASVPSNVLFMQDAINRYAGGDPRKVTRAALERIKDEARTRGIDLG